MAAPERRPPTAEENRTGIYATLGAMAVFIVNDAFVKSAGSHYPVGQLMVIRGVFATAIMFFIVQWSGELHRLRDAFRRRVLMRGVLEALVAVTFISAVTRMPIGDTTAILQASPVFITVIGAILGYERVGPRSWLAVLAGFAGVLLIVRPGTASFTPVALVALASAMLVALRDIATRAIPADVPTSVVSFTTAWAVIIAGGLVDTTEDWVPLATVPTLKLIAAAGFVAVGNVMIVAAYRRADFSVIAPFRYSIVVFSLVVGFFVFGERPDALALTGAAMIAASGLYTVHRERIRSKERGAAS